MIDTLDEYNGYSFLDAVRHGDISRVKKFLTNETINFRHFKTGDSPLVNLMINKNREIKLFLISSILLVLQHLQNIVVKLLKCYFDVVLLLIF